MSATSHKLTLALGNEPHKVSALSSLFRSLQAAVRETAAGNVPIDSFFSLQDGPFLVAEVDRSAERSLKLLLWFVDRQNEPIYETSEDVFERTLDELEKCVNRGSQHSFWGSPASAVYNEELDERMSRFISGLRTIGSATIAFGSRKIVLENDEFSLADD